MPELTVDWDKTSPLTRRSGFKRALILPQGHPCAFPDDTFFGKVNDAGRKHTFLHCPGSRKKRPRNRTPRRQRREPRPACLTPSHLVAHACRSSGVQGCFRRSHGSAQPGEKMDLLGTEILDRLSGCKMESGRRVRNPTSPHGEEDAATVR